MRENSVMRWRKGVERVEYKSGTRCDKIVVVWRGESKRIAKHNDVSYTSAANWSLRAELTKPSLSLPTQHKLG